MFPHSIFKQQQLQKHWHQYQQQQQTIPTQQQQLYQHNSNIMTVDHLTKGVPDLFQLFKTFLVGLRLALLLAKISNNNLNIYFQTQKSKYFSPTPNINGKYHLVEKLFTWCRALRPSSSDKSIRFTLLAKQ